MPISVERLADPGDVAGHRRLHINLILAFDEDSRRMNERKFDQYLQWLIRTARNPPSWTDLPKAQVTEGSALWVYARLGATITPD